MSRSPFKEKQASSINMLEVCQRCGKPREGSFRGTITRLVFRAVTCECVVDEQIQSSDLKTAGSLEQHRAKTDSSCEEDDALTACIDLGESDRYEILERLGRGGMGTVYRLKDRVLDKEFAVKVLHDGLAAEPSAVKRFEQEADAASQLTHANILATYGRGVTVSGACYILMDLIEGENLSQLLKRETRLDAQRVIDISAQICDALAHAHMKGLIHRDLKPSNIMLTNCNEVTAAVKVVDFGIAKLKATSNRETQNLTETGELFGSPSYMSPEQCLGCVVDSRSDIYSLGCMMYEMLSGEPPFIGKNPVQTVVQQLKDEPRSLINMVGSNPTAKRLEAVIMKCLKKNSADRYQSMDELKVDLQLIAEGKSPKQVRESTFWQPPQIEIPVSWPIVLTAIFLVNPAAIVIPAEMFSNETLSNRVEAANYALSIICVCLWFAVLARATWKRVSKVATSQTELHEKWLAATLVWLMCSFLPAVVLSYSSTYLASYESGMYFHVLSQSEIASCELARSVLPPALLLTAAAGFLALLSAVAWLLARIANAYNLSPFRQRLVIFLYLGMLATVGMVGHRYFAKIPLSAEKNFSVSSQTSYRPNPALELALAMDPDLAEAYDDRGCEKLIAGEPSAGADFSKALQLRPSDAILYMRRAKADELVGQFAKAASDLQRCQKLGPGIASVLDLPVAYYLGRAKQYDKALAIYDDVIGHPGGFGLTQAYALRSDIHLRLGNLKQALADVNKAMAEAPGDATFLILRAQIHEKNGEANLATEDYKAVLKKRHSGKRGAADDAADVDKAGTHLSYAIAAQKLGLLDQAKEDLAQAAKYKAPRETNGFNEIHDTWLIPDTPRP